MYNPVTASGLCTVQALVPVFTISIEFPQVVDTSVSVACITYLRECDICRPSSIQSHASDANMCQICLLRVLTGRLEFVRSAS